MAREDYNDVLNVENMSDDELKQLVLQQLGEHSEIDVDRVEVGVAEGAIRLAGRVGTEQELQLAEHLISDRLGVEVHNELVVDELVRGQRSEAADIAAAEDNAADSQLGGGGPRTSDTADHLMNDVEAEQFGTHDMQDAIERGTSYSPPDRPIQEGVRGRENH